jgi:hypothetical protein
MSLSENYIVERHLHIPAFAAVRGHRKPPAKRIDHALARELQLEGASMPAIAKRLRLPPSPLQRASATSTLAPPRSTLLPRR